MPRPKLNISALNKEIERENSCLTISKNVLLCIACHKSIQGDRNHIRARVKEHLKSEKHIANEKERIKSGQTLPIDVCLDTASKAKDEEERFFSMLTRAFVSAKIPLARLASPLLAELFREFTKFRLPPINTLRCNYVKLNYQATLGAVKRIIANHDIFIYIDDTFKICGRCQVNFIISPLNGESH